MATTPVKEAWIIARLPATPHASLVVRKEGVSFATVWPLAEGNASARRPAGRRIAATACYRSGVLTVISAFVIPYCFLLRTGALLASAASPADPPR